MPPLFSCPCPVRAPQPDPLPAGHCGRVLWPGSGEPDRSCMPQGLRHPGRAASPCGVAGGFVPRDSGSWWCWCAWFYQGCGRVEGQWRVRPCPDDELPQKGSRPGPGAVSGRPGTQSAAGGPAPPCPRGASSAFPAVTRSEAQSACGSGAWLLGAGVPAPGHSQDSRDPVVSSLPGWPSRCENLPL